MIIKMNEAPTAPTVEASLKTPVPSKETNMNNVNTIQSLNHLVLAQDGALITTSINVAEAFGKLHKDVLRKIENLDCSLIFNERNFTPVEYLDAKGEKRPMWEMTKDGFMFLVMGFTGKKAAMIKEAYINAFNWMAKQISETVYKKTTTDERTSLRNAVNLLVSKKGLNFPDAYSVVHQRFKVEHLDQLDKTQLTQAVEYVHKLALDGEYLPAAKAEVLLPPQLNHYELHNIKALCTHMEYLKKYFDQYKLYQVFTLLNSPAAPKMIGHIRDGVSFAANVRKSLIKIEVQTDTPT